LTEILLHHSNFRLPYRPEHLLEYAIVTPRMHGIHHSPVREETESNWSSGLTLWDRLHGTLRLDVPQQALTIGTPAYRDPGELTLPKILAMPFGEQRPAWPAPAYFGRATAPDRDTRGASADLPRTKRIRGT
jgi:sterol desaturase/sphingolipid hydroxylase (fatty acid hydroxylase superfamily)